MSILLDAALIAGGAYIYHKHFHKPKGKIGNPIDEALKKKKRVRQWYADYAYSVIIKIISRSISNDTTWDHIYYKSTFRLAFLTEGELKEVVKKLQLLDKLDIVLHTSSLSSTIRWKVDDK